MVERRCTLAQHLCCRTQADAGQQREAHGVESKEREHGTDRSDGGVDGRVQAAPKNTAGFYVSREFEVLLRRKEKAGQGRSDRE